MIYTFQEQLIMSIKFIILGMFMSIMLDTIHTFFKKIKIINYILQFLSWVIISIICIKSIDRISGGYIPIYIFLFFVIGYVIYHYFMSKQYIKVLLKIKENRHNLFLALFPVTLYNNIIKIIKKIRKNKGKKNEESNSIDSVNNDDSNSNRLQQ